MAEEPNQSAPGPDPNAPKLRKQSALVGIAKYSHLAFAIPGATIVGLLIGAALDKWLGTTWITTAGLIFGIIAGFVEMGRAIARMNRES